MIFWYHPSLCVHNLVGYTKDTMRPCSTEGSKLHKHTHRERYRHVHRCIQRYTHRDRKIHTERDTHTHNLPNIRFWTNSSILTFRLSLSQEQLSKPECIVNTVPAKKLVSATPTNNKSGIPWTVPIAPNPARSRRSMAFMVIVCLRPS